MESSNGRASRQWWSKKKSSQFSGTPLDRLAPQGVTKTTITGGRVSEESDKKTILEQVPPPEQSKYGINKSVSTTVVAERSESRVAIARKESMNRGRKESNDSGSSFEFGDDGRGRPAIIHERF